LVSSFGAGVASAAVTTGRSLSQMLEGGTWKAGRVIAKILRADGSPPITIDSDGTVF
jgi:hypothetical protein